MFSGQGIAAFDIIFGWESEGMKPTRAIPGDREGAEASERRIHRNTYFVIALTILIGSTLSGKRMAASILVGGLLCLLNQRWLSASVTTILGAAASTTSGTVPRWTVTKFILRYAVIGTIAGAALWSRKVDLIGFGVGIAAIVWAVMIEAGYQIFLTFRNRDS